LKEWDPKTVLGPKLRVLNRVFRVFPSDRLYAGGAKEKGNRIKKIIVTEKKGGKMVGGARLKAG